MSQAADLYDEKIAAIKQDIEAARMRLAESSATYQAELEREIAIAEALLPFLERGAAFLKKTLGSP